MSEERINNRDDIGEGFIKRLSQFYPQSDELERALQEHIEGSETLAQLFNNMTHRRGKRKSHASGKQDGKISDS